MARVAHARRPAHPRTRALLLGVSLLCACGSPRQAAWEEAQAAWRRGETTEAYRRWLAIDPQSDEGQEARRRIEVADPLYRRAAVELDRGDPAARETLDQARAVAPMDPRLYLPFARACQKRGYLVRAIDLYEKYLAAVPDGQDAPETAQARAELLALAPESDPFAAPAAEAATDEGARDRRRAIGIGLGAVIAIGLSIGLATRRRRGRTRPLAAVAAGSPELHPTIAYLVGSLRHELLKHRVSAIEGAVRAMARGDGSPAAREFLAARLYGGEPIEAAWRGHVETLERALGLASLPAVDPEFRRAARAIRRIAALRAACLRGEPRAAARLLAAHAELARFDARLARLAASLQRSVVDEALLREVVAAVRAEYEAGAVALDELRIDPVPDDVAVEVYRSDLRIILKNVVRNAVLAAGRDDAPRRLALDVDLDLLPTGEEAVRIRVRDTSREPLTTEAIYARRVERGLGLVTAALDRYRGAIEVVPEPAGSGFAKAVVVRLFRALDDATDVAEAEARPTLEAA